MNTETLVALDALARNGTISAAAEELGVTQQAVSARLRKLQEHLGVQLAVRGKLTETGQLVHGWAKPLVEAAEEFERLTATLTATQRAVRVGASLTVAEYLLPGWLVAANTPTPQQTRGGAHTEITVKTANSAEIAKAVIAGELDVGFVETPHLDPAWKHLHHAVVAVDELAVVVAPQHPWATRRNISAATLAATPLILREEGSGTRATFAAAIPNHVAPAALAESSLALKVMVKAGVAPGVVSLRAVVDELAAGTLVRVPVLRTVLQRPITALWREEKPVAFAQKIIQLTNVGTNVGYSRGDFH